MSIISDIMSGGISGILTSVGQFAKDIRQAITGELSPEKKAELEQRALEIEYLLTKAQTDINLEEAKHPNIFVSGWRPAVGWVCAFSLAWQFIISPMFEWCVKLLNIQVTAPSLDTSSLITILFALLGLGGMRSYEKIKNAEGNRT